MTHCTDTDVDMDRRSSLQFHLGQAQSKISSLEEYIRDREKQIRSAVNRFERSESRNMVADGRRRAGLSHNLLHMRTMSQEEEEQEEGGSRRERERERGGGRGHLGDRREGEVEHLGSRSKRGEGGASWE